MLNNFKVDELTNYARDYNLHIIGVVETWLHDNIGDGEISIPEFTVYRKDRKAVKGGKGGGVLLYVRDSLVSCACKELNEFKNESVWCKLLCNNNRDDLIVGVIYRSPSADVLEIKDIELAFIEAAKQQVLIMGDFNYPNINWDNMESDVAGEKFFDLTQDLFLTQHVFSPTRGNNILDFVFSSEEGMVENLVVREHFSNSDHNVITFELIQMTADLIEKKSYLNFNKGDYVGMNSDLSKVVWESELCNLDTNCMWNKFQNILSTAIDKYVPVSKPGSRKRPPWMSNKIRKARNRKAKMWCKYKNSNSYNDRVEYKRVLNNTTSLYKKAKKDYEVKLAEDIKINPKSFYAYVKSKSKTKDRVGPIKDQSGHLITNNKETCNVLNDYFASVFTREPINDSSMSLPKIEQVFKGDRLNVLQDVTISEDMVFYRLTKLKPNKAPGVDNIVPKVLIETAKYVAKPLCLIFNKSLEEGIVPDDWKRANVCAIYKKGPKDEAGNYRPVSLTSQVCKLLESIIRDSINEHLIRFNLIKSSQHGFVKNKSCLTNLLEFLNFVCKNVDKGLPVDVIYLDFQKAFDKVPHGRLLLKLEAHGIDGKISKWVEHWLRDREQRVVLNGSMSAWSKVISGVPQGSVLGPLLFVIYINDIDNAVHNNLLKFADDTKSYGVVSSPEQVNSLREDLSNLCKWSSDWLMLFNIDKCKVMHFGKNNRKEQYSMCNTTLQVVEEERDLGVIVQNDLKISAQCSKAVKTANRVLGMISRSFVSRSKEILIPLYKTLVRPHLEYCIQAWRPHLQKDIIQLEKVQRRVTKMVEGMKFLSYENRLSCLNLTTLETRRLRGDLIEVLKILKGFDDVNHDSFFTVIDNSLRGHSLKLFKSRFLTNCGKFTFANRVVEEWNLLTHDIVSCSTVNSFKNLIDQHLRFSRGFI